MKPCKTQSGMLSLRSASIATDAVRFTHHILTERGAIEELPRARCV